MKKIGLVWIAVIAVLALAACGQSTAPKENGAAKDAQEKNEKAEPSTTDIAGSFGATIEKTVLVDEQGVKITAEELTYSGYTADLHLLIENNTEKELTFNAGSLGCALNSVNGYMVTGGYIGETVAAGMHTNEAMTFDLNELSLYGISDIADIGLGFEIQEGYDDFMKTGPLELKTSIADSYDYKKDTFAEAMSDKTMPAALGYTVDYSASDPLFDEAGVKILNEYVITNKDGNQSLFIEVANSSDQNLLVVENNVLLNGIVVSDGAWDSELIVAGKRAVLTLEFDRLLEKNVMEVLNMDQYGSCGMILAVQNEKGDSLAEKPIEISFGKTANLSGYDGDVLYDQNGYRFMKVGLVKGSLELLEDLHAVILVKNDSGKPVYISPGFNDVYVNKTKINALTLGKTVPKNGYALLDIQLDSFDLDNNGMDLSNITEVATKFSIGDDMFTVYDEAEITMTTGK